MINDVTYLYMHILCHLHSMAISALISVKCDAQRHYVLHFAVPWAYVSVRTYICTVRYMRYEICNTCDLYRVVGKGVCQWSPPMRIRAWCYAVAVA